MMLRRRPIVPPAAMEGEMEWGLRLRWAGGGGGGGGGVGGWGWGGGGGGGVLTRVWMIRPMMAMSQGICRGMVKVSASMRLAARREQIMNMRSAKVGQSSRRSLKGGLQGPRSARKKRM